MVFEDRERVQVLAFDKGVAVQTRALEALDDRPVHDEFPYWHTIRLFAAQRGHESLVPVHQLLPVVCRFRTQRHPQE